MSGALIVLDPQETFNPDKDIVLLLSVPRRAADGDAVLLNGTSAPTLREMRIGEHYRLRVVNIHTYRPSMIARLVRDSTLLTWRALARRPSDITIRAAAAWQWRDLRFRLCADGTR